MTEPIHNNTAQLEERLLHALRFHLAGLRAKIVNDFSQSSFDKELAALKGDPVYPAFAFDTAEYVLVRLVGRVSISIGRRLGEIYDKIPRLLAAERFGLLPEQVAPMFNGLQLDIGLPFPLLSEIDRQFARKVVHTHLGFSLPPDSEGLGIEIRYNFNPNDSSRLRKDVDMAQHVKGAKLLPIYLVFSSISPRNEAIDRLTRAGWHFVVGTFATEFAKELLGLDVASILDSPKVKAEIQADVDDIMKAMIRSYAFRQGLARHSE